MIDVILDVAVCMAVCMAVCSSPCAPCVGLRARLRSTATPRGSPPRAGARRGAGRPVSSVVHECVSCDEFMEEFILGRPRRCRWALSVVLVPLLVCSSCKKLYVTSRAIFHILSNAVADASRSSRPLARSTSKFDLRLRDESSLHSMSLLLAQLRT